MFVVLPTDRYERYIKRLKERLPFVDYTRKQCVKQRSCALPDDRLSCD